MQRWVPQSVKALRHYNRHLFSSDFVAGVTVRHVPAMDASGLQALEDLTEELKGSGRMLRSAARASSRRT